MLFFASLFFSPQYDVPNSNLLLAGLGGVLYLLGAMASATGMRNLRVAGKGTSAVFGRETMSFTFPLTVTVGFFLFGLAVFTTKTNTERI